MGDGQMDFHGDQEHDAVPAAMEGESVDFVRALARGLAVIAVFDHGYSFGPVFVGCRPLQG